MCCFISRQFAKLSKKLVIPGGMRVANAGVTGMDVNSQNAVGQAGGGGGGAVQLDDDEEDGLC